MVSLRTISTLRRLSALSGLFVVVAGCLVFCGWLFDIAILKSIVPGLKTMNPVTALCFVLAGSALWLLHRPAPTPAQQLLVHINISLILVVAFFRLLDYSGLLHLPIDLWLFADRSSYQSPPPAHMAPFTAVSFISISFGLLLFHKQTKHSKVPAQFFGLFTAVVSFLVLIGYAFTLLSFNTEAAHFIMMPLNTAFAFVALGLGILCAHPDRGILETATANYPGSYMLRRLLPVVIALPFLLGWLRIVGQSAGWYNMETGATLYTMSSIAIISAIAWYTAKSLNKMDVERKMTDEALVSANGQLRHTNTALKQASEVKTDLLNIAAHDMKNPLGAIRTMAELIQSYPDDRETTIEMTNLIRNSADQMLHLIEELLRTAALENGSIQLYKECIDISALLVLVVDSNTPQAQHKSQDLLAKIESGCMVEGDFSRLREVADNLISNAIKYSPAGKSIWVSLAQKDGKALIEIRDEGPGLTGEDMKKIFGKFQRLHARPTGNESSTGLGLSIVKQLVEMHNGRVWAESDGEGKGAAFFIELPSTERPRFTGEHLQSDNGDQSEYNV